MSLFYLVRHGQTTWNTEKRLQGHRDSPLTDLGKRQALALAERLKTEHFDQLWCSSAGRARQTAQLLGFDHPHESDELKEMNLGAWEGRTKDEIWQTYGEKARHFWHTPQHFEPFGGESFALAQHRLVSFFQRLAREVPASGRVLVISHGMALQLFLNFVEKETLAELYRKSVVHQASLSLVESDPHGNWQLHFRDDQSHLGGLVQNSGQVV